MKILTKREQEKILDLLIKSGTVLATDEKVPFRAYRRCNDVNYEIADLVGGFGMRQRYYCAILNEFSKMGGK